ncbi:hypothetical protein CGZ80_22445 [Rhodopirellula sp. MGV]|nr:hypothetical protein CGZ80_22445 [Rhodopirellula sp. MGV]
MQSWSTVLSRPQSQRDRYDRTTVARSPASLLKSTVESASDRPMATVLTIDPVFRNCACPVGLRTDAYPVLFRQNVQSKASEIGCGH